MNIPFPQNLLDWCEDADDRVATIGKVELRDGKPVRPPEWELGVFDDDYKTSIIIGNDAKIAKLKLLGGSFDQLMEMLGERIIEAFEEAHG